MSLPNFFSKDLTLNQFISRLPGPIAMRFFLSESTFQALHLTVNVWSDQSIPLGRKSKLNVAALWAIVYFAAVLRELQVSLPTYIVVTQLKGRWTLLS